ncbi:hypothetical protein M1N47_04520 [Dehalococcoidia bacterium]|nr:hypothetical protein [Dehalococcoidia bacterium]
MKLKGIRTIALLLIALVFVVGSVAGAAAVRAGEVPGTDVYWWEDEQWKEDTGDSSPYERQQVRDILILILDTYFAIDISRMSLAELDEVGRLIGFDLLEDKLPRLFEHYAQKKGIEMPEPPEPTAPLPVEPDPYWWYIVGYPEATIQWIMEQVAEAKGMSPDEVRASFGELFPGVELWSMSFGEFAEFIDSLPRPPLEPISFQELKDKPNIIVFGRVPEFSGEQELREFNQKLEKLLNEVLDKVVPLLRELKRCEFPLVMIGTYRGAISIDVPSHCLPRAQEIYLVIAQKAESLFGIDDVPVVFRAELRQIRFLRAEACKESNTTSCDWEAP